jgi:hypothetical protein
MNGLGKRQALSQLLSLFFGFLKFSCSYAWLKIQRLGIDKGNVLNTGKTKDRPEIRFLVIQGTSASGRN